MMLVAPLSWLLSFAVLACCELPGRMEMLTWRLPKAIGAATAALVLLQSQYIRCDSSINPNADPWFYSFNLAVGPDGPWNAIPVPVDYPDEYLTMLPSLSSTNIFVPSSACSDADSNCVHGSEVLWTETGAHKLSWEVNSTSFDVSTSFDTTLEPLQLRGAATYMVDRITLEGDSHSYGFNDGMAIALATNINVTFPESYYTMSTSLLSLNGDTDAFSWTTYNGSKATGSRLLPSAYQLGQIPSISYGLHIGSNSMGVNGSFVFGGYDQSRCLTTPITSGTQDFELLDIGLGVSNGGSAFLNMDGKTSVQGLLGNNSEPVETLKVMPNPGVPYFYLPQSTCSAIVRHLPVYLDKDVGLYIWNTTNPDYSDIIKSPHYMSFTFSDSSSSSNGSLYVPFALLNLTLDRPVVSTSTQYFPCSPYEPTDGSTYHLGRAFLQSAYMAQNWQQGLLFLSQAPGPDLATTSNASPKSIASSDTTIKAMVNPPLWNETWTTQLTALPANTTRDNSTAPSLAPTPSTGLSGGAIAGIVIGVIVGVLVIAALAFFLFRRKRRANRGASTTMPVSNLPGETAENKTRASTITDNERAESKPFLPYNASELQSEQIHEAASPPDETSNTHKWPVEVDGVAAPVELDGRPRGQ